MSKKRERGRKERSKKGAYKIYQRDGEEMIREYRRRRWIMSGSEGGVFIFVSLLWGGDL